MYPVKITKLSENVNQVRTKEIIGLAPRLPQSGESFIVLGEGLEFGMRRLITSVVEEITQEARGCLLKTRNSIYRVEYLTLEEEP